MKSCEGLGGDVGSQTVGRVEVPRLYGVSFVVVDHSKGGQRMLGKIERQWPVL